LFTNYEIISNVIKDYGICNRLDYDTSGIVIVAKNDTSFNHIRSKINDHKYVKIYIALLNGILTTNTEVNNTIGCREIRLNNSNKLKYMGMVINSTPKNRTVFIPLQVYKRYEKSYTLTAVRIYTGSRNQIRAHAYHIGKPIVSDTVYGDLFNYDALNNNLNFCSRMFLHAMYYKIIDENSDYQNIYCPLFIDLENVLKKLQISSQLVNFDMKILGTEFFENLFVNKFVY
jgi:23S rRNA-/tRNA-specific pseudouridylate synthase